MNFKDLLGVVVRVANGHEIGCGCGGCATAEKVAGATVEGVAKYAAAKRSKRAKPSKPSKPSGPSGSEVIDVEWSED